MVKPDPDNKNDLRARWARSTVEAFMSLTGGDADMALQDLLCDLMHLCDRTNQEFDRALENARYHYLCETSDQP